MARLPVLMLLVAPLALAGEIDAEYHESFDVTPGARLELSHGDGDVMIVPWGEDRIQIDVLFHMGFRRIGLGRDPKFSVSFDQSGDTVRVREQWTRSVTIGGFTTQERQYIYEIKAPAWMALELRGEDGDVSIEGWAADVAAYSEDGDLQIAGLDGDLHVFLEDGDVTLRDVAGRVKVTSDDGDLELRGCERIELIARLEDGDVEADDCHGSFDIRSDDGDIELAGMLELSRLVTDDGSVALELEPGSRGEIRVDSEDGGVSIRAAVGVGVDFDLEAVDGTLRFDHPGVALQQARDGRATGTIGAGEVILRVQSDEGSIRFGER